MKCRLNRIASVLICLASPAVGFSQTAPAVAPLPSAPFPSTAPRSTAQVSGTITDAQGDTVAGASITLTPLGKLGEETRTSDDDGSFAFTAVPPSVYRLTILTKGFDLYTSGEFTVHPGASVALPAIVLKVSASASVNVVASSNEIAVAEIHEQEQQRVLGVFQNYYTSYIWDAKPMPVKEKYKLAFRAIIDPPQFLIVAGVAGAEHFNGTYPGYGPGIEGYGKRYGAALADATTSRIIGSAILPSILHQDPRYFYQGSGSILSRSIHAAAFTFTARGDNGKTQPNYSHLLGSLASASIANVYHPESSRGLDRTVQNFGIQITANIVGNLFREFVLRHLETVPDFANGKH